MSLTVTIDLPDEVASRFVALPEEERSQFIAMRLLSRYNGAKGLSRK